MKAQTVSAINLTPGRVVEGRVVKSVRYCTKGQDRVVTTYATVTPVEGAPFEVIVAFDS